MKALVETFGLRVREPKKNFKAAAVHALTTGRNQSTTVYYQMRSTQDAEVLRSGIIKQYKLESSGCRNNKYPTIGFLNRVGHRHVSNSHDIIQEIAASKINHTEIQYLDSFDGKSFLEQAAFMANVDILISPHGAQLTNSIFMPQCGGFLELFPRGYHWPELFGTLAASNGHLPVGLYTGPPENRTQDIKYFWSTYELRIQAKHKSVEAHPGMSALAIQELVLHRESCCQQQLQDNNKS
eukprot:Sro410_g137490.2  (239) ;mRNA; r:59590-60306